MNADNPTFLELCEIATVITHETMELFKTSEGRCNGIAATLVLKIALTQIEAFHVMAYMEEQRGT